MGVFFTIYILHENCHPMFYLLLFIFFFIEQGCVRSKRSQQRINWRSKSLKPFRIPSRKNVKSEHRDMAPSRSNMSPNKRQIELDLQEGDAISISSSSLESLTKPFSTDQTPAPVIEISSGSESTPSPPEGIHIIQYFNNDKQMPIHNKPQSGLDAKAIYGLCFGEVLT